MIIAWPNFGKQHPNAIYFGKGETAAAISNYTANISPMPALTSIKALGTVEARIVMLTNMC